MLSIRPKKNGKSVKSVFFDLDETLIKNQIPVRRLFPTVFFDFQDQIGAENKEVFFYALQELVKGLWERMFSIPIEPEKQLVNCFAKAIYATEAVPPQLIPELAKQMVEHFFYLGSHNVELHDGAIETLERIRSKGIKTGLITNGIVEAKAHKPYKPVFDLALKRAQAKAHEAWHVGDHVTNDVAGAVRAGLNGIFYNPHNRNVEQSFVNVIERPCYTINHLSEVVDLLEAA